MTIRDIRALTGLNRTEFAKKYNIPLRSLENWEAPVESANHRECPGYVIGLLENAVIGEMINNDFKAVTVLYSLMYKEATLEMVYNDMEHDYLTENTARNGREVLSYMDECYDIAIYKDTLEELTEEEKEQELY